MGPKLPILITVKLVNQNFRNGMIGRSIKEKSMISRPSTVSAEASYIKLLLILCYQSYAEADVLNLLTF